MLSRDQAQMKVELKINEPDPYWPDKPKIVVLQEATIEKDWGWVFFYQSSKYLETNEFDSQLVGNGPYIVNKLSGELIETGTAYPIKYYIDEYERKITTAKNKEAVKTSKQVVPPHSTDEGSRPEPFVECRKCGHKMVRISPDDSSPLIVECQHCSHREYAEIQVSPPWSAESDNFTNVDPDTDGPRTQYKLFDFSATPLSAGEPGENSIIPLGWIFLWIIIIAVVTLLIWIVL